MPGDVPEPELCERCCKTHSRCTPQPLQKAHRPTLPPKTLSYTRVFRDLVGSFFFNRASKFKKRPRPTATPWEGSVHCGFEALDPESLKTLKPHSFEALKP